MRRLIHLAATKVGVYEVGEKQDSRYAPSFVNLHEVRGMVVAEVTRHKGSGALDKCEVRMKDVVKSLVRGVTRVDVLATHVEFWAKDVQADFVYRFSLPKNWRAQINN